MVAKRRPKLSKKQIENIYYDCSKYESAITNQVTLEWYSKERKENFINAFFARDFIAAAMLFSNYQSLARERLVWLCYKRKILSTKEFSMLLAWVYTGQNLQSSFFDALDLGSM